MKYVDANLDASGFNVDYILLFYPSMSPKLEYIYIPSHKVAPMTAALSLNRGLLFINHNLLYKFVSIL